jgi:hypothetical protein
MYFISENNRQSSASQSQKVSVLAVARKWVMLKPLHP